MRLPRAIVGAHLDLARARHAAADVGNAQAAFPVLDHVAVPTGVISGLMSAISGTRALVVFVLVLVVVRRRREAGDEEAQALVHLRRGQADAVVLAHRLDHVVDQLLDRAAT